MPRLAYSATTLMHPALEELEVCTQVKAMGHRDVLGRLLQLKYNNEWVLSASEGQTRKERIESCPLYERITGTLGFLLWEG